MEEMHIMNNRKKNSIKNEKFNLEVLLEVDHLNPTTNITKDEQRIFAITNYKENLIKVEELPYRGGLMLTYKLSK